MARRRKKRNADSDPVVESVIRGDRRRGLYGGVYGVSYVGQSYYLSPDQFGYTTSQSGNLTTTGSGGESAGGDAGGGGTA